MFVERTDRMICGDKADVHARLDGGTIAFCGVYVRPIGPVPGYWYFPEPAAARAILTSLGVQS
jgi:hypothetical protein